MQTKFSSLYRTAIVLMIATVASGAMVSTTVSAQPQSLFSVAGQAIA